MIPQQKREEEKSVGRKIAERQIRQHGNKLKKKIAKKGAKLAAKLVKKAAMKFVSLLAQLLGWLVGAIGLPTILIGLAVVVAFVVISLSWSYLMGTGEGLSGKDKENYQYIVSQANSTVNMNSALERPYRVPEKLISATIQLSVFQKNDDIKSVIKKMASDLAPDFSYGKYDEWKEKQETVCEDGKCTEGKIQHTENLVTKIENVNYWNGSTDFHYTPKVTPWESHESITYREEKYTAMEYQTRTETTQIPYEETVYEKHVDETGEYWIVKTETKYREESKTVTELVPVEKTKKIEIKTITKTRHQYFESSQTTTTDYSTFDNILNSYGLGMEDKKLIEANYMFMGGDIAYTDWLKTRGGGDIGFGGGFDGNVTPGAGVPPQFMPYYLGAQKKFGVDWYVLAAVHFVETSFSTGNMISPVGAIGPMQFMPATWCGWSYNIGGGLVSSSVDMTSLAVIARGQGAGQDGDGDGKADPWNNADSIYTAAYYLKDSGYAKDPRGAIYSYNHADWYVNKVLMYAEKYKSEATYSGGGDTSLKPGGFIKPTTGTITSPFGHRDFTGGYNGETFHFGIDIASGGKNVPIVAAADGVVIRSNLTSSYGNAVFIKHNINGQLYVTVYAHMQNRVVSEGQTVKQGQYLGNMGQTGDATGIHLHFELHKGEYFGDRRNAINPALLIQF